MPVTSGALAAILLLPFVSRHPMFRDEAASLFSAGSSWDHLWTEIHTTDAVFTLYYALLHPLMAVGAADLEVARGVSVIGFGVVVGATFAIGRLIGGTICAVIAAALTGLNPLLLREALNARPYTLATAAVSLAILMLLSAARMDDRRKIWTAAGFIVLAAWLHFFSSVASVAVIAAVVLGYRSWASRQRRTLLLSGAYAAALVIPVGVIAYAQRGQVSWIPRLSADSVWSVLAPIATAPLRGVVQQAVLAAVVIWLLRRPPKHRRDALTLLTWLVGPAVLLVGASVVTPMLVDEYLTFSTPAPGLLVGYAATLWHGERAHRPQDRRSPLALASRAGWAVVAVALTANLLGSFALIRRGYYQDDFRSAAGWVDERLAEGDVMVLSNQMVATGMSYYLRTPVKRWPSANTPDIQGWDVGSGPEPDTIPRIWVSSLVASPFDAPDVARFEADLRRDGFAERASEDFGNVRVRLFARR